MPKAFVHEPLPNIVHEDGQEPLFKAGDHVKISIRYPIGVARRIVCTSSGGIECRRSGRA